MFRLLFPLFELLTIALKNVILTEPQRRERGSRPLYSYGTAAGVWSQSLNLQQQLAAAVPLAQGIRKPGTFSVEGIFQSVSLGSCMTFNIWGLWVPHRRQPDVFSLAFLWGELRLKNRFSAVLHFHRIAHKQEPAPSCTEQVPGLKSKHQALSCCQLSQADLMRCFCLAAIAPNARKPVSTESQNNRDLEDAKCHLTQRNWGHSGQILPGNFVLYLQK